LFPNACEEWGDVSFDVTEKLDGQSVTYFCIKNSRKGLFRKKWLFGVCSRNFQLLKPDKSSYWTVAVQENIKEKMLQWCRDNETGLIIQGEIIGSGVQGNKYNRKRYELYVFNVVSYNKGQNDVHSQAYQTGFCAMMGLNTVPWLSSYEKLPVSIPLIVDSAKGESKLVNIMREGLVYRNYPLNISFKVVNPDFLLKYSE
jgi:hypothetical protein